VSHHVTCLTAGTAVAAYNVGHEKHAHQCFITMLTNATPDLTIVYASIYRYRTIGCHAGQQLYNLYY